MKNLKRYLYPPTCSLIFIILYRAIMAIEATLERDNYAGALILFLLLGVQAIVYVPICCAKYGKMILNVRYRCLFALYNCLALLLALSIFCNLESDISVGAAVVFFLWTLFWTLLPLIIDFSSKREQRDRAKEEK